MDDINKRYTYQQPMERKEFIRSVTWAYNNYDADKMKKHIKNVHFNKNCGLTRRQKVVIANQENGPIRCQKSCDRVRKAVNECIDTGEKITKSKIIKLSGLSKNTVKKYWDEVMSDLAPQAPTAQENDIMMIDTIPELKPNNEEIKPPVAPIQTGIAIKLYDGSYLIDGILFRVPPVDMKVVHIDDYEKEFEEKWAKNY